MKLTYGRWLAHYHTFVKMTLTFKSYLPDLSPGLSQTPCRVLSLLQLRLRMFLCRSGVVRHFPQPEYSLDICVHDKILLNKALELSVVIGMIYVCIIQYDSHQAHVPSKHLKLPNRIEKLNFKFYFILINLYIFMTTVLDSVALEQCFSTFTRYQNHVEAWLKQCWSPCPECLIQQV